MSLPAQLWYVWKQFPHARRCDFVDVGLMCTKHVIHTNLGDVFVLVPVEMVQCGHLGFEIAV